MHSDEQHPHHSQAEGKATHNMLVVGQQTVFLSHLPMFSAPGDLSPHRFQVILEASFTKAGSDPQALYFNDRKKHPATKIYTLNPEPFVLPNLVSKAAPLGKFSAQLLRGHFEKGGTAIAKAVAVNVRNVIHFREFDPQSEGLQRLTYILFGNGSELFLAHVITKPPDFDQILAIRADHKFTDDDLRRGLQMVFAQENSITQRLQAPQEVVGAIPGIGNVTIKVGTELYLEEGELRVPADFDTTDAERMAGFP
jgi:hypothetical protein